MKIYEICHSEFISESISLIMIKIDRFKSNTKHTKNFKILKQVQNDKIFGKIFRRDLFRMTTCEIAEIGAMRGFTPIG